MGSFQSDTLRDIIESNWALTGALAKVSSNTMKNPVKFFAHDQVKQIETKKSIEVKKETPLSTDVIHQKFTEINDVFTVMCRYTVEDVKNSKWDISEGRMEDMNDEVLRIIKLTYNPNTGTGVYYKTITSWVNKDEIDKISQVLIRTMTLTLTRIKSEDTTVFKGYGGVLSYDTSASTGDDKPAADYIYTEAYDVQWVGGFRQIPEATDVTANGAHVPVWFTGLYSGRFNCMMNIKKADFTDTGSEQIPSLGQIQNNGESAEIVFTWVVTNTESTPSTLTASITLQVVSLEPVHNLEDLSKFRLVANVIKPPTYALT